jgi:hypothetical protein
VCSNFFSFFWKGPYILIGPSPIFLEHWALFPIDAPLWTPSHKNKNKCVATLLPTFSVYIHESWTLGKAYGIKLSCHWGENLGEQLENLGILIGTWWEHIENERKKSKKSIPLLLLLLLLHIPDFPAHDARLPPHSFMHWVLILGSPCSLDHSLHIKRTGRKSVMYLEGTLSSGISPWQKARARLGIWLFKKNSHDPLCHIPMPGIIRKFSENSFILKISS